MQKIKENGWATMKTAGPDPEELFSSLSKERGVKYPPATERHALERLQECSDLRPVTSVNTGNSP